MHTKYHTAPMDDSSLFLHSLTYMAKFCIFLIFVKCTNFLCFIFALHVLFLDNSDNINVRYGNLLHAPRHILSCFLMRVYRKRHQRGSWWRESYSAVKEVNGGQLESHEGIFQKVDKVVKVKFMTDDLP